MFAITKFAYSL